MDRLFLDANVLFSAAYRSNSLLSEFWNLKDALLCSSHYAIQEARLNLEDEDQRHRLEALARGFQLFAAPPEKTISGVALPEKDLPILLAAIEAKATHLITGDLKHFGRYFGARLEGIWVMRPAQYWEARGSR